MRQMQSAMATDIFNFRDAYGPEQAMSAPKKTHAQALAQRLSVHRSVGLSGSLPSNAGWLQKQSRIQCLAGNHSIITHSECNPYTTQ